MLEMMARKAVGLSFRLNYCRKRLDIYTLQQYRLSSRFTYGAAVIASNIKTIIFRYLHDQSPHTRRSDRRRRTHRLRAVVSNRQRRDAWPRPARHPAAARIARGQGAAGPESRDDGTGRLR